MTTLFGSFLVGTVATAISAGLLWWGTKAVRKQALVPVPVRSGRPGAPVQQRRR